MPDFVLEEVRVGLYPFFFVFFLSSYFTLWLVSVHSHC